MTIEIMIAMFLFFALGLLIGHAEGMGRGWDECVDFYQDKILPMVKRGKR